MTELFPLTQQQMNVMLGAATVSDVNSYVLPVVVTASERLDRTRLAQALSLLGSRHPSLRLRVRSGRQFVTGDPGTQLRHVDVAAISDRTVQETFRELVGAIDVENGPVWNAALISVADEDRVVFAFHHFAADMLSLPTLIRDVAQLYALGAEAPPAQDSYLDYLRAIPLRASASGLSSGASWWTGRPWDAVTRTAGIRPELLPTHGLTEQVHRETLPWGSAGLKATEEILVRAVALAISRAAGTSVVRLDLGRHGRAGQGPQPSHRRAAGWLAQAVPHFLDLSGGLSPQDCARQLGETAERETAWAEAHQFMCGAGRATSGYLPFAHASVNVQGLTFREGQRSGVLRLSAHQPDVSFPTRRAAHVPIRLTAHVDKGSLHLRWRVLPVFRTAETPVVIRRLASEALSETQRPRPGVS